MVSTRAQQATKLLALVAGWMAVQAPARDAAAPLTVHVEQGDVRGTANGGVRSFLGVPFAAPPIGELRWKAPVAPARWTGHRDASAFGANCLQPAFPDPVAQSGPKLKQSEDCLYLNIWAPAGAEARPRPVMVWIHGGGYFFGAGSDPMFNGANFVQDGVILVTINYRLGAFGFLAHSALRVESPDHASGNYGILDQIAALKWIKANIAAFGGDPANVTIFGESAGSGSVSILEASPLAKGLFQRAIGESTSQLEPSAGMLGRMDVRAAEAYGAAFAKAMGGRDLAELRALPAAKIVDANYMFWPTEGDDFVLPDLVYNLYAAGRQNRVPTLIGWNAQEGSNLKMDWVRPRTEQEKADFARLYLQDPVGTSSTDAVQWQMRSWADLQDKAGVKDTWMYRFDHAWPGRQARMGAFHGSEIIYVFGTFGTVPAAWSAQDQALSKQMRAYWVNFARTGNPNGPGLPAWPRYEATADRSVMRLSDTLGAIAMPRPESQHFLDDYFRARR